MVPCVIPSFDTAGVVSSLSVSCEVIMARVTLFYFVSLVIVFYPFCFSECVPLVSWMLLIGVTCLCHVLRSLVCGRG